MKKHFFFIHFFILVSFLFSCNKDFTEVNDPSHPTTRILDNDSYVPGIVHVKFKKEQLSGFAVVSKEKKLSTNKAQLNTVIEKMKISEIERTFHEVGYEEMALLSGLEVWYNFEYDPVLSFSEIEKELMKLDFIEKVEPRYKMETGSLETLENSSKYYIKENPFNDPIYQWGLYQENGCDINAYAAWEVTTGVPEVRVAVMDTGIYLNHEDLSMNLIHPLEPNKIDAHGTLVAGIIGAVNNNSIGISGVAGGDGTPNSGIKMIFYDYGDPNSYFKAANDGAVIINCSFTFRDPIDPSRAEAYHAGINHFMNFAGCDFRGRQTGPMKGGLVVASAGNNGNENIKYPAGYEGVISVASLTKNYICIATPMGGSNYGEWIDFIAPGFNIISTGLDNDYISVDGTSFAAPHVSGVAALVVSELRGDGFTVEDLKSILIKSSRNVDDYNWSLFKGKLGHGLIDAYAAVKGGDFSHIKIEGPDVVENGSRDMLFEIPRYVGDQRVEYINWQYATAQRTTNIDNLYLGNGKIRVPILNVGEFEIIANILIMGDTKPLTLRKRVKVVEAGTFSDLSAITSQPETEFILTGRTVYNDFEIPFPYCDLVSLEWDVENNVSNYTHLTTIRGYEGFAIRFHFPTEENPPGLDKFAIHCNVVFRDQEGEKYGFSLERTGYHVLDSNLKFDYDKGFRAPGELELCLYLGSTLIDSDLYPLNISVKEASNYNILPRYLNKKGIGSYSYDFKNGGMIATDVKVTGSGLELEERFVSYVNDLSPNITAERSNNRISLKATMPSLKDTPIEYIWNFPINFQVINRPITTYNVISPGEIFYFATSTVQGVFPAGISGEQKITCKVIYNGWESQESEYIVNL